MAQTLVTGFTEPFVDTHPFYRSTFIPARTVVRTATGSGNGFQSVAHTNYEQRLGQLTDFTFPYRFGGRFYLGVRAVITVAATASGLGTASSSASVFPQRQGTGSGVGSETSVRIRVPVRTATGSGVSTENSTGVRVVLRTATGSGVGSTTSQVRVDQLTDFSFPFNGGGRFYLGPAEKISPVRTATGSGLGTESAARLIKSPRTATGSGIGSGNGVDLVINIRTATGSGTESSATVSARVRFAAATGSGTGSAVSVHYKFHMFRPPVELVGPFMLLHGDKIANKLGRRFEPFERGKNVYQLNNLSFTENDPWSPDNYIKVFHGGHVHALTEDEYTDLVAAGYGANIT